MQDLKFLNNPDLRLILFGGKGGSGKTTSAAAATLHLSKIKPDKKILMISIDPAHSLGDSFNIKIGNNITHILSNIWGYEINASELLERYKAEYGAVIKKITKRGTFFDDEDIENFFVESIPGLDEVMAIIKIADILNSGKFDIIVLDTAPTGHTTVFLSLPQKMERWIEVGDLMMKKHRYMVHRFTGKYVKDECDEFIESQREDIIKVKRLLSDAKTTEFVPVTIPEPLSIYETERLIQLLEKFGIPVNSIIANHIVVADNKCTFCMARRKEQEKYIKEMAEKFDHYNLIKMPLFFGEIRGIEELTLYGEILFTQLDRETHLMGFGGKKYKSYLTSTKTLPKISLLPKGGMENLFEKDLKLIIFGGKGGVGKTSIASATALQLAQHNKNRKFLIFSTDPAHSLSDSFDQYIGNEATIINGTDNLYALELDAYQMFDNFITEYGKDIKEAFEKFSTKGINIKFDGKVMEELVTLSPPGLEELMALNKIIELMNPVRDRRSYGVKVSDYDCFVMDSAASGHLVRFLETPDIVGDWLKNTLRLILKYRGVTHLSGRRSVENLLCLLQGISKIKETLINPELTEFEMITIPEEMGIREMEDLYSALHNLKIPCFHTIINMIIPLSDCDFCTIKRQEQQKYIQHIESKVNGGIVYIPLILHDVSGKKILKKLAEFMFQRDKQNVRKAI